MFFLNLLYESGDNPMICEICSHIGLRGNKFCPRCNAGGDKKSKMSDAGYDSLFYVSPPSYVFENHVWSNIFPPSPQPCIPRNRDETCNEILSQFRKGLRGEDIGKDQTDKGIKDLATTYWLQDEARQTVLEFLGICDLDSGIEIDDTKLLKYVNPFFTLEGTMLHRSHILNNDNWLSEQDLILTETVQSKSCTRCFWESLNMPGDLQLSQLVIQNYSRAFKPASNQSASMELQLNPFKRRISFNIRAGS